MVPCSQNSFSLFFSAAVAVEIAVVVAVLTFSRKGLRFHVRAVVAVVVPCSQNSFLFFSPPRLGCWLLVAVGCCPYVFKKGLRFHVRVVVAVPPSSSSSELLSPTGWPYSTMLCSALVHRESDREC